MLAQDVLGHEAGRAARAVLNDGRTLVRGGVRHYQPVDAAPVQAQSAEGSCTLASREKDGGSLIFTYGYLRRKYTTM